MRRASARLQPGTPAGLSAIGTTAPGGRPRIAGPAITRQSMPRDSPTGRRCSGKYLPSFANIAAALRACFRHVHDAGRKQRRRRASKRIFHAAHAAGKAQRGLKMGIASGSTGCVPFARPSQASLGGLSLSSRLFPGMARHEPGEISGLAYATADGNVGLPTPSWTAWRNIARRSLGNDVGEAVKRYFSRTAPSCRRIWHGIDCLPEMAGRRSSALTVWPAVHRGP